MTQNIKKVFDYIQSKNSGSSEINWTSVPTTLPVESFQVLWHTLMWYNQWLFLVSMWWFWVFIENYLREKLIKELTPEERSDSPFDLFTEIDNIEQEIEEWTHKDINIDQLKSKIKSADWYKEMNPSEKELVMKFANTKWMFQYIVDELFIKNRIKENLKKEIIKKYHNIRSAVQHWVYRKLYNEYKDQLLLENQNLRWNIPMTVIVWRPENTKFFNGNMNSEQTLVRNQQIVWIAELVCTDTLEIIHKLLSIFESDYI